MDVSVAQVRDLGCQLTENPYRIVGLDGSYSIPTDRGLLFYFGDTLIGERIPGESLWYPGGEQLGPGDMGGHHGIDVLQNNTVLICRESTGRHGLRRFDFLTDEDGIPRQIVPRLPDEHPDDIRVWCQHGIGLGDRTYLSYINVRMLPEGPMPVNFEILGSGLAVGETGVWRFERIEHNGRTLWWGPEEPRFGSAYFHDREAKMVYAFGVRMSPGGIQNCYLSRVPEDRIASFDEYEYFAGGDSWSANVRDAVPVFDGVPNELSVNYNAHLGCFFAVHSYVLTGDIVARTARSLSGPWSEPIVLHTVEPPQLDYERPYEPPLIYAAKEHAALSEEGGRVLYITYIEFEEYFPHLIEVTLR